MISEKQLKKEIKATKKFIKYLINKTEKHQSDERFIDETHLYLDGLEFALNGKLE